VNPLIAITDLVNRFGDQTVHDGLELDVHKGEILAVVGGSGSGKTVLLRSMLGLHAPTSGTVEVMDRCVTEGDPPPFERLGVVFQHSALFSQLTVCENVAFPVMRHARTSMRTARELAEIKLQMAGLERSDFDKYPSELSGGMRKRVGLARALVLDPALLFLDEPTGGLDPVSASEFDALIEYLHRTLELTVVMITHDLATLYRVSDRVAALCGGRALVGPLAEVAASDEPWIREYFGNERARAARQLEEGRA